LKTRQEELCELLDIVFDSAQEPDWAVVREKCYDSWNTSWLMTKMFRLMWLCAEDQAAFDEEVWRLTNGAA
jgi:hypothetical protein